MSDGGGSYANLLCAHPPFQLDGNMGSTAGVAEMLLQSHTGMIELLPALPGAWPEGEVKGLRARGGYTVDIRWEGGKLKEANITAAKAGSCTIAYQGRTSEVTFQEGEHKTITF